MEADPALRIKWKKLQDKKLKMTETETVKNKVKCCFLWKMLEDFIYILQSIDSGSDSGKFYGISCLLIFWSFDIASLVLYWFKFYHLNYLIQDVVNMDAVHYLEHCLELFIDLEALLTTR